MIKTANVAYFESTNLAKVNEIENEIEKGINEAIEKGRYECRVCPFQSMSPEVKARIIEDLTKLGYKVEIEDNDTKYKNAPCDQRPWYDDITINWNKEKKK